MATAFVTNGGNVIIVSRKEKALSKACDTMNALKTGGKASYVIGDVSSKAGCEGVAAEIKKRTDKVIAGSERGILRDDHTDRDELAQIHVLVNNSGATWGARKDVCLPVVRQPRSCTFSISIRQCAGERYSHDVSVPVTACTDADREFRGLGPCLV